MAQCVSHMRQRVGTTPDGTTVLIFIADVILCKTGLFGSAFCPFFPFKGRQFVDVAVMQRTGHAVLNTLRITRKILVSTHVALRDPKRVEFSQLPFPAGQAHTRNDNVWRILKYPQRYDTLTRSAKPK